MRLNFDRELHISVGQSRWATDWRPCVTSIGDLWERLGIPIRGAETREQYFKLEKAQQDRLKDVGGFVGGSLASGRRKADQVTGRDLVTLDLDTIPAYATEAVLQTVRGLGFACAVYSTRKHIETAPRLRILFPLDRTVTADEYEPIARRIAEKIGIQMADPTTFEASRLMYWPSCCADSNYIFDCQDAPLLKADDVLGTYADWKIIEFWPQVPGESVYKKLAARQGNPLTKPGIVGAFNRYCGSIETAMEKYLPGIYAPVAGNPRRFTYVEGSTTGGAVIYDNGNFLYSHHATDPCSRKLVNCFDLVRLHKFDDRDLEAKADTPINRLPSYKAMCDFLETDKEFSKFQMNERLETDKGAFADLFSGKKEEKTEEKAVVEKAENKAADDAWKSQLEVGKGGTILSTINNVLLILGGDAALAGKFAHNSFAERGEVLGPLPWEQNPKRRAWQDSDTAGLYWYLEYRYGINRRPSVDSALDIFMRAKAFNEVEDYLDGLTWDGTKRLDTLFIDYLGAEDDPEGYTRAVTRKSFAAAVARAMRPGCKYDCMLILCGPQGIGKSTILDKMSRGWFNDSIRTFEGKEAAELLPGSWLIEVAELDAFRRTEVSRIKQFLSLRSDKYRAAYGRYMTEQPRRCVFFGTCNESDFLQDTTGNRRFWPVDCKRPATKSVWVDLTEEEIDQVWAEAKARWQMGEELFLKKGLQDVARSHQEEHREQDPWESMIQEFLERHVPRDWSKKPLETRRDYWYATRGGHAEDADLIPRDRVCVQEIWCECIGKQKGDIRKADAARIRACLAKAPSWERAEKTAYCGCPYGTQRCYKRITED